MRNDKKGGFVMNKFQIIRLHDEPYDFLIIATSYENPLHLFDEIGKELKVEKAKLLFDLTLINGTNKNRYIECEYSAEMKMHCSLVEKIDDCIKILSRDFFFNNNEVVNNSVIPNSLKYLLQTGNYPM